MQLAFYKAFPAGKLYQKGIAWWTGRGPYCHTEIVFPEWDRRFYSNMDIREYDAGGTLCFSSAENDGGTRFKILDLNAQQWDLIDVPLDYDKALAWCIAHQHIQYDFWGLRGFVFHKDEGDTKKLWCSETAARCGQDQQKLLAWPGSGKILDPEISPNDLARAVGLLK